MTTLEMEVKLMEYFDFRRNYVVPNLTRMSGLVRFETDILSITKSGYATGVEIKVSKSDLKNDLNKRHWKAYNRLINKGGVHVYKEKFFGKLKYFYYAVPPELVEDTEEQIPDWCGILTIGKRRKIIIHRKAEFLYNYKYSQNEIHNMLRLGSMRIYSMKKKELKNVKKKV